MLLKGISELVILNETDVMSFSKKLNEVGAKGENLLNSLTVALLAVKLMFEKVYYRESPFLKK